jgi:hypothetical protein
MKPWSEVEQSKKYQSLSSEEKQSAKKEYWDTVVTQKEQYQALPQKDKDGAYSEFFGQPPKAQTSMLDRAKGIAGGIGKGVKWAITPLMSPEQVMQNPIARQVVRSGLSPVTPAPIIAPESMKAGHLSGMTSPLAIAAGAIGMGKFAKTAELLPAKMGKGYLLDRATRGANELEKMRLGLGQAKGQAVARVADKTIKNFKPDIPEAVLKKLQDPIYKIEFTDKGAIKNTIGNVDKVKDALGDLVSNRAWKEVSPKKLITETKRLYGYLSNAMKETDSSLKSPIQAFHNFMKDYTRLKPTFSDTKGVSTASIETAIKSDKAEAAFKAWERLSKKSPELSQVMKDVTKFIGRKGAHKLLGDIKKWGIRSAVVGAVGLGAGKVAKKMGLFGER